MEVKATLVVDGKEFGNVYLDAKTFSTGSQGYYAQGKLNIEGKRYQGSFQLVEIGSKPADGGHTGHNVVPSGKLAMVKAREGSKG